MNRDCFRRAPAELQKSGSFASSSEYRPEFRRRPCASIKMQSQFLTNAGRCAMTMIVFFPLSPATTSTIAASVRGSKFDVAFVDYQDLGIAVEGSRDTQSLTLAARETSAALTDNRTQFARQRAHEMIDLRRAQRVPYPLVVDLFLRHAKGDVAPNAVVDQIDGLRDISDISLPAGKVVVQIVSVQEDPARGGNQQAQDEIGEGGFAGAGRTDEGRPNALSE